MCEYSSEDGFSNDWHLVHLGSRAVGGAVWYLPRRLRFFPRAASPRRTWDCGKTITFRAEANCRAFVHGQGARAGVQLAHAGRKASMALPWAKEQRYLTPR